MSGEESDWQETRTRRRAKTHLTLPAFSSDSSSPWSLITDKPPNAKRAGIYVGNLKHDIDENGLRQFISSRVEGVESHVTVHTVSFAPMKNKQFSSARVAINQEALKLLTTRDFWPGRVYSWPWKFQDIASGGNPGQSSGRQQQQSSTSFVTNSSVPDPERAANLLHSITDQQATSAEQEPSNTGELLLALSPESIWGGGRRPASCCHFRI